MSTLETSTTDLDNKINALALVPSLVSETDWAEGFARLWDISIPLAMSVQLGYVSELTDDGVNEIERCFTALSFTLGMTTEELLAEIQTAKSE